MNKEEIKLGAVVKTLHGRLQFKVIVPNIQYPLKDFPGQNMPTANEITISEVRLLPNMYELVSPNLDSFNVALRQFFKHSTK